MVVPVEFHGMAAGGEAVGRDDGGRVVFAPYAAPGDCGAVTLDETRRSYSRGRLLSLETASPLRTAPPCPYYLPAGPADPEAACGGCQLQHLNYEAQLAAKRDIVRDALRRIGGLTEPNVLPCLPSPQPFAYRNKADFVVAAGEGGPRIGFFARASHDLIDIARCPIQQEQNNALLQTTRAALVAGMVTPFDPATGRGVLRRLVARTAGDGTALLTAVTTGASWPRAKEFAAELMAAVPTLRGVLQRRPKGQARLLAGVDWLEEPVLGLRLRVSGEGFFQVNSALTPALVEKVLALAACEPGMAAVDLFAGVGLFGLALARAGVRVTGIEANAPAVRDAQLNARQNGLTADFRCADAAAALRALPADPLDLVVLDPPRAGAPGVVPELLRRRPRRIVYVSCDPATLARDVRGLCKSYRLEQAVPVDLFPQTAHVETVAQLLLS